MHPFFLHRIRLALYVLTWLVAGVAFAQVLRLAVPQPGRFAHAFAVPLSLVLGFAVLSAWWVCRANPLTGGRVGRAVTAQLGAAVQVAALWTGIGALWGVLLTHLVPQPGASEAIRAEWPMLFAVGVPVYVLSAVRPLSRARVRGVARRRSPRARVPGDRARGRAPGAARPAEPALPLQQPQLDQRTRGLATPRARVACVKVSVTSFVARWRSGRATTWRWARNWSSWTATSASSTCASATACAVERTLEPGIEAFRVPPLLLQPLVENAVKHGVAGCVEGGTIRITARSQGGALVLDVENPVDADAPARIGTGMGLENVRRRLDAFGARAARLDAERGDTSFRVRLVLPARGTEREEP